MWSCDSFQNSIHSKSGGIPFQMFRSGEGIPRKAATFGMGRNFSLSSMTHRHIMEPSTSGETSCRKVLIPVLPWEKSLAPQACLGR